MELPLVQLENVSEGKLNHYLSSQEINVYCILTEQDALFLEQAIEKMGLSIRAWHSLLKVARSIADLADQTSISRQHLCEALTYRAMDRLLHSFQQTY